MKVFIPATLLALAGATVACTFSYESYYQSSGGNYHCYFTAYLSDKNKDITDKGRDDIVEEAFAANCWEDPCVTLEGPSVGGKYKFCIDGTADEEGVIDGDLTIQREGGSKLSIKRDGEEKDVQGTAHFRRNISCPGAEKKPKPSSSSKA